MSRTPTTPLQCQLAVLRLDPKQAWAALDLVRAIEAAIWEVYEKELDKETQAELALEELADAAFETDMPDDDEIPY